jgi:hypothetical protein
MVGACQSIVPVAAILKLPRQTPRNSINVKQAGWFAELGNHNRPNMALVGITPKQRLVITA